MAFEKKLNTLLGKQEVDQNKFIAQGLKESNVTTSGNGAKKYSTSGNDFVDDFSSISSYKEPRSYSQVSKDMELLWSQNPLLCLKLAVYIRMITRKTKVVQDDKTETLEVQRGQGLKNEGIMRLLWLAINQPATFKANFNYFVAAGSWKDVFEMLSLDLQYHGWENRKLDWNFFLMAIAAGFANPETTHLVRKYLPTIRTNKRCKTIESQADTLIGRWLAHKFSPDLEKESAYKAYRKVKSEGIAHQWQQLISKQLYDAINFDKIAGRALALLVGSKFLENHGLVNKYSEWIQNKPTAKYTGFVFELFAPLGDGFRTHHIEDYKEATINAQFAQLVQTGKENVDVDSRLLVVRDTSSSMTAKALGCNMSSFGIGKAMALYFSKFLTGTFSNTFAEFDNNCVLHQWKGETVCDQWINDECEAYGSTNFQSVISLFIQLKAQGVPESDFPTGLLCVSDGEFNRCGFAESTNFQEAIRRLKEAGFSKEYVKNFKIILWDIPNGYYGRGVTKARFEDFADAPNFFHISGYDASAVAFVLSAKSTLDMFNSAMDQELLNRLQVVVKKKKSKNK